ncbi:RHS repeat-associated core domain-containing protein [Stenotrophomonas sp. NRRL B-14846]|uniref:RHS repeat-associated core domain-containing protein n=1 Tax=Stenotrophomonas sp. NRRL B-14846 TaxID=3162882 RepID=UPI003D2DDAE4
MNTRKTKQVPKWLAAIAMAVVTFVGTATAQTVTYIHTDALGSPVAETDASGNVIKRYAYEPYGAVVGGEVTDGPGYTGHVSDAATGLSYMQQRYMDPQLGAFLSVDPVTAQGKGDMRLFNRYAYAFNNPYTFDDPDGRCPSCDRFGDAFAKEPQAFDHPGFTVPAAIVAAAMAAPVVWEVGMAAMANPATTTAIVGEVGAAAGVTGVGANQAVGKAAERLAAKELVAEGNKILGSQVGARTSSGLRVIDHLVETPSGKVMGIEVKAGNGVRNSAQLTKDAKMATEGAVLTGKNAPEALRGQRMIIETVERRYPNK